MLVLLWNLLRNFFLLLLFREDLENSSDRNLAIVSSLATVLQKNFNVKSPHAITLIERCPTFVSKEKSIKSKFLSKNKKVSFSIQLLYDGQLACTRNIWIPLLMPLSLSVATHCQRPSFRGPPVFQCHAVYPLR